MGCGRGELLEQIHGWAHTFTASGGHRFSASAQQTDRLGSVARRGQLPPELDGLSDALVFANEWLDVVPCPIAELDQDGELREVLVTPRPAMSDSGIRL